MLKAELDAIAIGGRGWVRSIRAGLSRSD